ARLEPRRGAGDPDRDRPRPAGAPGARRRGAHASAHVRGAGRGRERGRLMRVLTLSHRGGVAALSRGDWAGGVAAVLAEHARGGTYLPLRSVMVPPGAAGFLGLIP